MLYSFICGTQNQHSELDFTSIGGEYLESSFDSLMSLVKFLLMLGSRSLKSNMLARVLTESSWEGGPSSGLITVRLILLMSVYSSDRDPEGIGLACRM